MSENRIGGFSEDDLRRIARHKINYRMGVKIHLGIFIIISVLLFLVNLIFTPSFWWFLFPTLGWLVGVAEHITAYLVYARGVYPYAKRGVYFHLVAYLLVVILMFAINLLTLPSIWWVFFPALFWGTGLLIHIIAYFVYYRGKSGDQGELKSRQEIAIEREMEKMRKRLKQ